MCPSKLPDMGGDLVKAFIGIISLNYIFDPQGTRSGQYAGTGYLRRRPRSLNEVMWALGSGKKTKIVCPVQEFQKEKRYRSNSVPLFGL